MKNILIPTTLSPDTVNAVETALAQAYTKDCSIVLMLITETPDTPSAAGWLRRSVTEITPSQENTLDLCFRIVTACEGCTIRLHRQYAVSTPLFNNLLKSLETQFVVIPYSFSASNAISNRHGMKVLANLRYPLLQLTATPEAQKFERALYLEKEADTVEVNLIQQIIRGPFSVRIISQAKAVSEGAVNAQAQLYNTIHQNEIDLLVETRRPQKIRLTKKKNPFDGELGLPILSICEPITA